MILISIAFIYDYIVNDKYTFQYSLQLLNKEDETYDDCSEDLIIDLEKYGSIEENYQNLSNNFLLIDMLKNNSVISRNQILNNNFKGFKIRILYLCQEGDENCLLRKEDEIQNFYYVTLKYKTFNLTYQNEIPLQASNEYSIEKYPFYFNYTSGTVVY